MLCTVALGNPNGTTPANSWINQEYHLNIMWAAAARSGAAPGLMRNLWQHVTPPPHVPPPAAAAAAAPPAPLPLAVAGVSPPGLPGVAVGPATAAPGVPQPLPSVAVGPAAASSFRGNRWNHSQAPTPRLTDIENRLADIESRLADIESSLVADDTHTSLAQVSGLARHILARVEALEMLARPGGAQSLSQLPPQSMSKLLGQSKRNLLGLLHLQPPQKSRVLAHPLRATRLIGLSLIRPGTRQLLVQRQLLQLEDRGRILTPLAERGAIMLLVPLHVYVFSQFEKSEKRLFSGTIMLLHGATVC